MSPRFTLFEAWGLPEAGSLCSTQVRLGVKWKRCGSSRPCQRWGMR